MPSSARRVAKFFERDVEGRKEAGEGGRRSKTPPIGMTDCSAFLWYWWWSLSLPLQASYCSFYFHHLLQLFWLELWLFALPLLSNNTIWDSISQGKKKERSVMASKTVFFRFALNFPDKNNMNFEAFSNYTNYWTS